MTLMMLTLLIWDIINLRVKRTFPVDNHIPIDGRGVTEAFLMDNTPMKLFFGSGASRSCQRNFMILINLYTNFPSLLPVVQE